MLCTDQERAGRIYLSLYIYANRTHIPIFMELYMLYIPSISTTMDFFMALT